MESAPVDWGPGLLVLAAALVAGAVLLRRLRASGPAAPDGAPTDIAPPVEVRDLLAHRDALFDQLRELDDVAAKRTPAQLARERYALELQAATVLRDLDRATGASVALRAQPEMKEAGPAGTVAAAETAWSAARPGGALRGFLWGAGAMVAVGALLYLVTQATQPRPRGGPPTGSAATPSGASPGTAAADPEQARLEAVLEKNPDDLDARLALARVHIRTQNFMGVWNEARYVLGKQPGHPLALTYEALMRQRMGQPEMALDLLRQAVENDPGLLEAYLHAAFVSARLGRAEEMEATLGEVSRRFPDRLAETRAAFVEIRGALAASPPPAKANPHAGLDDATTPMAQTGPERKVAGTIDLDPALKAQAGAGGVVFVMLRDADGGTGPPLAARRYAVSSFPLEFEIGFADAMSQRPVPDTVLVEARLDSDGDPATRPRTDPRGRADHVRIGTKNIRLRLERP